MPLFQPSVLKFMKQRSIKSGVDLMNEGQLEASLLEFLKARSEVANDPIMMAAVSFYEVNAHRLLAQEFLTACNLPKAEEHAKAAVQVNPEFADMRNLLGKILMGQGRLEEALAQFDKALSINASFVEAMVNKACVFARLGMRSQTKKALDLAKKHSKGHCLDSHYDMAIKAIKDDDFEAACREIKQAFDLSASQASACLARGITLSEQGHWEEAHAAFLTALEYEPQFADVHNQLGIVCSERGQFDDAIRHFRDALSINPHFVAARLNLGFALSRCGRHFEALEELKFVVAQSGGGPSGVTDMISRVTRSVSS